MTCMLWDIEAGTKVTEFNDHNGDVMRFVPVPSFVLPLLTASLQFSA